MRLTFHTRVQGEVNEAVEWYEKQSEGLGSDFFTKVLEGLNQVEAHPERCGFWLASKSVRRLKLKRFPYDLLYEIRKDRIKILCLRHEKRHPNFGAQRR
ncbi:type II toxin-antitoxin system RelE/ParE family toxin [Prosthecobacter algae]|uniref:Type II toxin-antitoxin system RelE/ParE family toxin n=1 Tax=Prosthecobacter algae TaxID=1144682 RepID=A0ABP9NYQ7_9BACT